jgi:hypothetical protein
MRQAGDQVPTGLGEQRVRWEPDVVRQRRRYVRLWWIAFLSLAAPVAARGATHSPVALLITWLTALGGLLGVACSGGSRTRRCIPPLAGAALLVSALLTASLLEAGLLVLVVCGLPVLLRATRLDPVPAPSDVRELWTSMSAADLCREWMNSFVAVKTAHSLDDRALATAVRGQLLDELERRDPVAFAAWLGHHPGAAVEPRWLEHPSGP